MPRRRAPLASVCPGGLPRAGAAAARIIPALPLLLGLLGLLAQRATPALAQEAPTGCAEAVRVTPESLQSAGAEIRLLPDPRGGPLPGRAWRSARSLARTPYCGDARVVLGWTRGDGSGEGFRALPLTLRGTANSAWAAGAGDGLQWAGKGLSGVARGGMAFRSGPVSVGIRPEVAWAENRPFAVYDTVRADRDRFAYPWHAGRIDWPVRHGASSVTWVGPGESWIAVEAGAVEIAASSEQVVWGPGLRYPLLLSAGAPGFPHLSFSSLRPLSLGGLGTLEGQLLWGMLDESDHFDADAGNDRRLLSGMVLAFEPAVFPGFTVGVASLVHSAWSGAGLGELFAFLQTPAEGEDSEGNVEGNGLGSIFARWAPPGSGFEAWVEWARDDYSLDFVDFLSEPDHTQAYAAGFQHAAWWDTRLVRFTGELVHLTNDEPRAELGLRSRNAGFYTHATVRQGHTHRGQLLGAYPGPGSDAQRLALDVLQWGRLWGVRLERVRWDDDSYVRWLIDEHGVRGHDVEMVLGLRHARPVGPVTLEVEADAHWRRNRDFVELQEPDPDYGWDRNLRLQATLVWTPDGGR